MRPEGLPPNRPAQSGPTASPSTSGGGTGRGGNAAGAGGGSGNAGSGGSGNGERRRVSPFGHGIRHLEGRLAAGLLVFIPILVTYFVFSLFYDFISSLLDPIVRRLNIPDFPGGLDVIVINVVEIIVLLIIVYIVGLLISWAAAKWLINIIHDVIGKLPVLGAVYRTTRQGIDFLSDTQEQSYRGVVLVEFPRLGVYSIGLITSSLGLLDGVEEYLSIYVPTTPVPSSGYLVVVPASKVMPTDISVDEAMRIIISGGILAGDIFAERGGSVRPEPQWPGRHSL